MNSQVLSNRSAFRVANRRWFFVILLSQAVRLIRVPTTLEPAVISRTRSINERGRACKHAVNRPVRMDHPSVSRRHTKVRARPNVFSPTVVYRALKAFRKD